ncbi:MAG: DNA polymerase III subunit delta [Sulfurimonas sp.]|jgi:DNA polymerase-3 subunit delta|nr:DNA polymerase III subunit delta [Sulfurimonas sp.]
MYKSEFDKQIQSRAITNALLFYGESSFLIDMYTEMMSNIEDASILKFYHNEYDFNSAKAHLSQASLFGDRNILIIKSEKKVPKKELDVLFDYCEKNTDNIFIYAYYGEDHKSYAKAYDAKKVMNVRFFHPKDFEAQNIVLALAHEKKVQIDKYSVAHLLHIHNGNVALACNELDKLKVYDKVITTNDINHLVHGLAEVNMDDFFKKILAKKDFLHDLENILEHGEDEIRILTAFTSYVTQLYMFNIYIRVHGAANGMDILGYPAPKFVVDEKAALSLKFKPQTYYKLHDLLLESELKMKSSSVDKSAILLSTLIRIQKLL